MENISDTIPKFRKLFVVEPTHDISLLGKYCDNIIFLTNGDERIENVSERMDAKLEDFDPDDDALIPMGRVSACSMAGILLANKLKGGFKSIVMIGVFAGTKYIFIPLEVTNASI